MVRDRKEYYQENKDKALAQSAKWQKENKEAKKLIVLRHKLKKHDATLEDYYSSLDYYNECCAICNEPFELDKRLPDIDHDHSTNKFRGLLCRQCNLGLGYFKDNEASLMNAISYLRNTR